MSIKAMDLVLDLECPKDYDGLEFRSSHKFTLLSYADHADHHGKNIYPAVSTVAKKTGLDERTVQRLTRELETMGMLIDDGQGPRGTRKWKLPINDKGWQPATPDTLTGGNDDKSLGDIPSGDIPSGDTTPPEFNEPEPKIFNISIKQLNDWGDAKAKLQDEMLRAEFDTWVRHSYPVHFENNVLWIATQNDYSKKWMSSRLTARAQQLTGFYVRFMTIHDHRPEVQEATQ